MKIQLVGRLIAAHAVDEDIQKQMFNLLTLYFDDITLSNFEVDLKQKDYVVLLEDPMIHKVKGFSTFSISDLSYNGERFKIIFSGDTIIDQEYWGTLELPRVWLKSIFSLRELDPSVAWYWLLICSGYKTYRYLPLFMNTYYPCFNKETDLELRRFMDYCAQYKFGEDYNPMKGTMRFSHSSERLKPDYAKVKPEKQSNPHIRFFLDRNPDYAEGMELVCIGEMNRNNLTSMALKLLESNRGDMTDV